MVGSAQADHGDHRVPGGACYGKAQAARGEGAGDDEVHEMPTARKKTAGKTAGRLARYAVVEVDGSRAEGAGLDEFEIHPELVLGKERMPARVAIFQNTAQRSDQRVAVIRTPVR